MPVIYPLLQTYSFPRSASRGWAWDPANTISALPSFSLFRSATRGTGDFKAGGGRGKLLHLSTFRDPLSCFWLLCISPCNASSPWQPQILFLAAFEYRLRFCPTLGKAASSGCASPDTSQPLFLLQRSGSHSGPSSELRPTSTSHPAFLLEV